MTSKVSIRADRNIYNDKRNVHYTDAQLLTLVWMGGLPSYTCANTKHTHSGQLVIVGHEI